MVMKVRLVIGWYLEVCSHVCLLTSKSESRIAQLAEVSQLLDMSFVYFFAGIFFKVFHLFVHDVAHNLTALWLSEIIVNQSIKILSQSPSLEYTRHLFREVQSAFFCCCCNIVIIKQSV